MAKDQAAPRPDALRRGRYLVRYAQNADDLDAAQRLRHHCFVQGAGRAAREDGLDRDRFDALCEHLLVEDLVSGRLVCCFRVMLLPDGGALGQSYSAQYYDLTGLAAVNAPLAELGRFCVASDVVDADVLRLAWGMLARFVDANDVGLLFGCSSFAGTDPAVYGKAFDLLAARHLAPAKWAPKVKSTIGAERVHAFSATSAGLFDARGGVAQLPPLLKTYVSMGGWVSDHAVIDPDMNTLHVFTGLEIAAIPPARARALRLIAG